MKVFINFLKKQPFLCAVLAVILAMAGIKLLDGAGLFGEAVLRIILAMAMGFFLYLISGEKTLDCCGDSTGYVIRVLTPCLILPAVIGLTGFLGFFTDTPIRSNWPVQLLAGALEMLSVGLFEEILFRAVINDGIMYQFRNFKGVWILCALVSSLVFGWVHVIECRCIAAASYGTGSSEDHYLCSVRTLHVVLILENQEHLGVRARTCSV